MHAQAFASGASRGSVPVSLCEAGEVIECAGNELLSTGILCLGGSCEQLEQVPRARGRFGTRCRGGSEEKILQFFLATSQRGLVSLNIVKIAPKLGVSLGSHPAAVVQIDRLVGHPGAFTRGPDRSLVAVPAVDGMAAAFVLADFGFFGSRLPRL